MKKIISTDSAVIKHSAEKIFKAVSDVTVYKDWWSEKVKIKVLETSGNITGSKVEIRASGGWFRCGIISADPPREIRIRYYDGVQRGDGIWKIESTENKSCKVTYSIDLEPVGFLPRLLSNFINFSKIHSREMGKMFDGLEKYLDCL